MRSLSHRTHQIVKMSCSLSCYAIPPAFAVFIYFLRKYMKGPSYTKPTSAKGKVIIVTGSNTGIGKETARELAKRGGKVYLACRDMAKTEKVRDEIVAECGNNNVHCLKLDLSSLTSVREFVEAFKKKEDKLDILINNAGVFSPPYSLTEEGFEMQIGVNHLGHFYLTHLLLDLLKKSAPSRIVVVSSDGHKIGKIKKDDLQSKKSYSGFGCYCQSKLANVLFTRQLANHLKGTKVTVNALHPGAIMTELGRHSSLYGSKIFNFLFAPIPWLFFKTPTLGAQTTIYAALDPDLENVSGEYFSDCAPGSISKLAKDDNLAKWLWDESFKLTKLQE